MNSPLHILVVDDEPDILDGTARLLEKAGYTVSRAASGEEALKVVLDLHPALLLLDRDLPEMDGLDICRRIKGDPALADIFVAMASGSYIESEDLTEGLESGADAYIIRPIANRELLARVGAFARIILLTRSLRLQAEALKVSSQSGHQIKLASLNLMEDALADRDHAEQASLALKASLERFELANRATFNVIWDWNLKTHTFWRNDNFQKLFGYSMEEEDHNFPDSISHIHPEDRDRLRAGLQAALADVTNEFWVDQYRFCRKDGTYATVEDRGIITRDAVGHAVRMLGAMQDISERLEAEAALRESEERHRLLADHASDVIWTLDLKGRFTYVSPSVQKLRGFTPTEVMQQPVEAALTPASVVIMQAHFGRAIEAVQAGQPFPIFRGELEQTCKNGTTVWTDVTTSGLYNAANDFIGILGITRDISERRQAEASLRLQGVALEAAANAIVITNREGLIQWANAAFTTFTGYTAAEAAGKHPGDLLKSGKHDRTFFKAMWDTILAGAVWHGEITNKRKDGTLYTEDMTITPLLNDQHETTHFVAVKQDITQRKQSELELFRLNRSLKMLSACDEALVRADNETDLLKVICEIAIKIGGYHMAWVGYAQDDENRSVKPMAHAGEEEGYLSIMKVTWSESDPSGKGPVGRAIRSGKVSASDDITLDSAALDPAAAHLVDTIKERGYRGVISLPLREGDQTFGALTLYSTETFHHTEKDLEPLQKMADGLAFGIGNIRAQIERKQMQQAVLKMAQSVPSGAEGALGQGFFDMTVTSLIQALGADVAMLGRFPEQDTSKVATLAFFAGDQKLENITFPLSGTPCEFVVIGETYLFERDIQAIFPQDQMLVDFGLQACAGVPLLDSKGQQLGLIAVNFKTRIENPALVDSTLRIFAARAAGELERLDTDFRIREQAALLDKAHDAILVRSLDNRILFWNKGAERLYGWTSEEMVDRQAVALFFDDLSIFQEAQALLLTEGEWSGNILQRRKDGNVLSIEAHWTLVRDDQGQPRSVFAINTDITERVQVEQSLKQYTVRLEALREIDAALLGARSTAELTQGALTRLRHIVPFERASVVLFDESHTEGTLLAVDQDRPWLPLAGEVRPIGDFHDLDELLAAPFLNLPDLHEVQRCSMEDLMFSQGLRNLVYIPMESEGKLLGFMALCATKPGVLTPQHVEIALDMTDQLVVAIQHTRMREELEASNVVLEARVDKRTADLRSTLATMQVLEAELRQREAEAQSANLAKSTFLASMSHELRTPLIGITGMLEILTQSELDPEQRQVVDVIQGSSESLLQIIGDILDFSKIEANKLELSPQTFSARTLLESIAQTFRSAISFKGMNFILEVDPKVALAHVADFLRIRQILNNFLSNAVKFTEKGSITLRLRSLGYVDGRESLAFDVEDTGIGISPANLAKLFVPFTQAEASTTRRFGGTGLGLTISRRLADLLGGSLNMQSTLGKGTTITMALDLAVGSEQDIVNNKVANAVNVLPTRPTPSIEAAEREHGLILLAEDHPTNRTVLTKQVNRSGYALETAVDGKEAFEKWQSGRYALLLTDLHMPRLDGYQLTKAVRDWERVHGLPRTPILALTANALGGEAERCLDLGMDDFMIKPVTIPLLASKLHQWMPHVKFETQEEPEKSSLPEMTATAASAPSALEEFAGVDSKTLLNLCGGNAEAAQGILEDFIATTQADLLVLRDGLQKNDLPSVARQAHRIKGSAAMIGADSLSDRAKNMEAYAKTETAESGIIEEQLKGIQEALKGLETVTK
jgi:PAS domain S-box-containing protein